MSVGEQTRQAATDAEDQSWRSFVAPPLDAYELRRLVLIGGCIAAAAVASFAGSAMPQRTPVAVGAALLGALLVLRRRRAGDLAAAESDLTSPVEAVDVPSVTRVPGGRRRARAGQAAALDAWLSDVRRQLGAHEQRLTSLSGRQTMLDLNAREQRADLLRRIEELELARQQLVDLCDRMRAEHSANLHQLEAVFVEHHQAITQLLATYGGTERHHV